MCWRTRFRRGVSVKYLPIEKHTKNILQRESHQLKLNKYQRSLEGVHLRMMQNGNLQTYSWNSHKQLLCRQLNWSMSVSKPIPTLHFLSNQLSRTWSLHIELTNSLLQNLKTEKDPIKSQKKNIFGLDNIWTHISSVLQEYTVNLCQLLGRNASGIYSIFIFRDAFIL